MKLICEFSILGIDPTPWSTPNIGTGTNGIGKKFRFTTSRVKSNFATGALNLRDWKSYVAAHAKDAMREAGHAMPLIHDPIRLDLKFYAQAQCPEQVGQIWDVAMKWNKVKGILVKARRHGAHRDEPDLTNLQKAVEDGLEGVVFHDDCKVRWISSIALYGRAPGVGVTVWEIEPGDFPGTGGVEIDTRGAGGEGGGTVREV